MASATLPESKPQFHHILDIPEQIESVLSDQCCIYKVPSHLLKLNEEAFTLYPAKYYIPRTATKLKEVGVSFEKVQGRSYLDIKFNKTPILNWFLCFGCYPWFNIFRCRLQIPQFKVTQITTECVVRNLIALEQCHYPDQPFICNYVSFIDSLIQTEEDVELLVEKEAAIVNELGSHEELATLVNGLCTCVVVNSNYYGKVTKELSEHHNSRWKRCMGKLRSLCYRSSTIVGVALFLFAVVKFLIEYRSVSNYYYY